MNRLTIKGNVIYLNDIELKDVVSYELKSSAADPGKPTAEFTVKLLVDPSKLSFIATKKRRVEYIRLTKEQKSALVDGLKRLSSDNFVNNFVKRG
jgi:hypothetical protein